MNTFPRSDSKKKCMAHALFDNLAETPDELAFRRGDTLVVLEQNTGGLEGWWLCSLRGRQGIVPGNRLRLIPGVYDPAQAAKMAAQMHASTGGFRRSWSPNAKISAMHQSTASLPRGGRTDRMMRQYSGETYDSPPAPISVVGTQPQEDYDTPRPHRVPPAPPPASAKPIRSSAPALAPSVGPAIYSAPRADAPAAPNRCSGVSITSAGSSTRSSSGSSSNRSSLEHTLELSACRRPPGIPENGRYNLPEEEYDVPRSAAPVWQTAATVAAEQETYDVPPTRSGASEDLSQPLELQANETYDFPPPQRGLDISRDTPDFSQPRSRPESQQTRVHPPPLAMDLSQETYDFPSYRPHEGGSDACVPPPAPRPSEMQSHLRIEGDTYDVPSPSARLADLELSDSSVTRGDAETDSPNDTLDTLDTYDYPRPLDDVYDSPRSVQESHPSPRPDLDIYDSPRAPSETSPRRGAIPAPAYGSHDSLQSTALSHRASTVSETSIDSGSDVVLRSERVRTGATSRNATYWLRSAGSGGSASLSSFGEPRELPLDMEAGLETVSRLEQELNATVERLFAFVVPGWRGTAHMEACAVNLKLTVVRMRTALRELVQFAYGAMEATSPGPEHRIGAQFIQVLRPLEESVRLIDGAAETQDRVGWTPSALCRPQGASADALDQLLACVQGLRGDVRQAVAFVRGNAPLIFRRRASVIPEQGSSSPPGGPRAGLMGDYDYVCLQTSGSLAEEGEEVRSRLPEELRSSFDNLIKESQVPVSSRVDANDHQVIEFYRGQIECHHEFLNNAIDALFQTIQNNQPPKVFVAHSKFVILSAHKLVYIGDTVHRNVVHPGVRRDALAAADALFATLKRTVQSTKTAALQFPSAPAVQEMADAVLDVSRAAEDLKLVIDKPAL